MSNKKEIYKKIILNNILKQTQYLDNIDKKKSGFLQGGMCGDYNPLDKSCGKVKIKIDPTEKINWLLNKLVIPINFLTVLIMTGVKLCIEAWNRSILILSTAFQNYIIHIIFSVNGYIKISNMFLDEIRLILRLLVVIVTEASPFKIMAIYTIPLFNELSAFFMDGITIDMFAALLKFDFQPMGDFFNSLINLLLGRTVKNKCNREDYSSTMEMNRYCHQWNVPACRLNIGTLYYIGLVFWITIYVSCWFSFFKIFYIDNTSDTNIIKFIRKIFFKN